MKKEIETLLKKDDGYLKLSNWCTLHRWTKDAFGNKVDCLQAEFSILHAYDFTGKINSRDWQGIIAEVQEFHKVAFSQAGETLANELKGGYIRG